MSSFIFRLRLILSIDAAATAVMATAFLGFTPWLAQTLQISSALLQAAGWILLVFASALLWAATRRTPPTTLVGVLVVGNALWAVESVLLLFTPWLSPNLLGTAFVLVQAVAVAGFAAGEYLLLRQTRRLAIVG